MIIKVKNLHEIPKTISMNAVTDCLSFARIRALFRDPNKIAYYYKRQFTKFPPLLFMEQKKQEEAAAAPPPAPPAAASTQLELPL